MDLNKILNQKEETPARQFSKEEYAAMKQAEREEVWARVDAHAEAVFENADSLRGFFDFMAKCNPQRTATLLLLHEQNPEITEAKSFDVWKAQNRSIQTGAEGYTAILGQTYEKDGRKASGYTIGKVYDITQTRGRPVQEKPVHEPDELVAAILDQYPVRVQISDKLPTNVLAQFVPAQRMVFVRNEMDAATTFCALAREHAMAEFAYHNPGYTRQAYALQSYCAAYVTAQRYGLDTDGFVLDSVVAAGAGMDAQGKRAFLSEVKGAVYSISRHMEPSLNIPQQEFEVDELPVPAAPADTPKKGGKKKNEPEIS